MADLSKFIQRNERNEINALERNDWSTTNPGRETLDLLVGTYFPAATEMRRFKYDLSGDTKLNDIKDKYDAWINVIKIKAAIDSFKNGKSPARMVSLQRY